ncbi:MAG: O-antigen ligase family protein [Parcubacteria group bacterium]|nr:O-antigen ligase family protein [Parcubacteria group bacterium]
MSLISPSFSANKLLPLSFWLFLFSLPLGARKIFWNFTAGFDEYEAVFLYASDFFLVVFLILFALSRGLNGLGRKIGGRAAAVALFSFILFSAFSVIGSGYSLLALTALVRLTLAVTAALAIAALLREGVVKFEGIALALAALAIAQSFIGFGQFLVQGGLGLKFLGEPEIGPLVGGAAKILAGGGKLLRAYGTFPHPNVFAAFLLLGLFGLYYLWMKIFTSPKAGLVPPKAGLAERGGIGKRLALAAGMFAVLLGLALSFSRAAWAVGGVLSLAMIVYWLLDAKTRTRAARLFVLLAAIVIALAISLNFAVSPRAKIASSEPAVVYRLAYNELGAEIIKNNPFGVGIGNQVVYSVKNELYQKLGMTKRWQWQPIHNIYILMAAEIGIPGLAAFLIFVGKILIDARRGVRAEPELAGFAAMAVALLTLGLFDHFLWTLQPGRLMLWLAIGLAMAVNRPQIDKDFLK